MNNYPIAEQRPRMRINHGLSDHPLYGTWKQMIGRCYSSSTSHFAVYGGRGIRVAERWMDFRNFVADMGPTHSADLTIDRIDPNGHYTPDNCRWATIEQQSENRRNVRFVSVDGKKIPLAKAAKANGLSPETVALRIRKGENARTATSRAATTSPAKRPIEIDGQQFPSLSEAARTLGVTRSAIFGRLKRGKATYIEPTK